MIFLSEEENKNQVVNSNDKVIVEVNKGDNIFNVELDTGACRSVISKQLYEKSFGTIK